MVKKCIVCDAEAEYRIKDTSDFYCQDCAEENFADLKMLVKVEEEARKLKAYLEEKMDELAENEEKLAGMVSIGAEKEDVQDD